MVGISESPTSPPLLFYCSKYQLPPASSAMVGASRKPTFPPSPVYNPGFKGTQKPPLPATTRKHPGAYCMTLWPGEESSKTAKKEAARATREIAERREHDLQEVLQQRRQEVRRRQKRDIEDELRLDRLEAAVETQRRRAREVETLRREREVESQRQREREVEIFRREWQVEIQRRREREVEIQRRREQEVERIRRGWRVEMQLQQEQDVEVQRQRQREEEQLMQRRESLSRTVLLTTLSPWIEEILWASPAYRSVTVLSRGRRRLQHQSISSSEATHSSTSDWTPGDTIFYEEDTTDSSSSTGSCTTGDSCFYEEDSESGYGSVPRPRSPWVPSFRSGPDILDVRFALCRRRRPVRPIPFIVVSTESEDGAMNDEEIRTTYLGYMDAFGADFAGLEAR
ncbi:MAG: hypothetical protein Q9220_002915 [cf. Caloplaca sp. 1 TL-2023]